ncbi:SpaH/EbpB family LPXTG-anchored major pilin [Agrococcus beijingensis]|uniref:SpaH/EbpB family LPXTG-anchored major pilin n=1 Tax=Agrococcus beijingensis TaxID=3068634 RepID=UPI00274186B4|nr:SpaH/EbpB family LPXTG-anchored major pilin [Agrococcus sp. REN33]
MATTKRSLTVRVAAGFGAIALATLTALGGALPASAIGPNVEVDKLGSIVVHKHAQPEVPGLPSNGLPVSDVAAPLAGVEFTAQLVPGTDLTTPEGWLLASEIAAAADPVAYAQGLITPPAPAPVLTTAAGTATFSDLPLGVYLVTEGADTGDNGIIVQSAPFLISVPMAHPTNTSAWLYDVHAYPKNSVTDPLVKTVDDADALELGDTVSWAVSVPVPELPADEVFDSFTITDQLDARLTYSGATVSGPAGLLAEHYSVTHVGGLVTVDFTAAGLAYLSGLDNADIVVTIQTVVNGVDNGEAAEYGIIPNTAVANINGTDITSNTVDSRWGLLTVLKVEDDTDTTLAGAVFELWAGVPGAPGSTLVHTTAPTGADGVATFPALREGVDYYLVETVAPLGYEIGTIDNPVQVFAGDPAGVVVQVENAKIPAYALPITGGSGEAAFMIGGFGLIGAALGFMLIRRRKEQAGA